MPPASRTRSAGRSSSSSLSTPSARPSTRLQQWRTDILRRSVCTWSTIRSVTHDEQERIRKLAKSKFATQQPTILNGRDNYTIWRDSVLMDANMIEAKVILDQTEPPDSDNTVQWQTKNEILHTRILQSIAPHVRETISWEDSAITAEIWARINSTYGLSITEERLMTVKALLDISPQGNYPAMIRDFVSSILQSPATRNFAWRGFHS